MSSIDRVKVAKQSSHDGLCSIYCLVNALQNWGDYSFEAEDRDCFRYLLEAADRLRLFSTHRVTDGFEAHEIVDVFNEFARAHRFPGRAHHFSAMTEAFQSWSLTVQLKRVFEQFGQAIIPVDNPSHWVLAHGYDFETHKLLIDDPDPRARRRFIEVSEVNFGGKIGVVLLPAGSTLRFPD